MTDNKRGFQKQLLIFRKKKQTFLHRRQKLTRFGVRRLTVAFKRKKLRTTKKEIRANNVWTIILFNHLLFIALLARILFIEDCGGYRNESGGKPSHSTHPIFSPLFLFSQIFHFFPKNFHLPRFNYQIECIILLI